MARKYNYGMNGNFPVTFRGVDFRNKDAIISQYICYMLARTQSMFTYTGLPDTLSQRALELYMQMNGAAIVTEVDGQLYAFYGGLGGEPNVYYLPTTAIIASPALNYNATLTIGEECVVIPSDSMYMGLIPLLSRYSTLMSENVLTMYVETINERAAFTLNASGDVNAKSAEKFLHDIEDGRFGVIGEQAFLDGVRVQPLASTNTRITSLIELQQYLKAGLFNELGLQANYNMKRESINSNEAQLNEDALLPLIDDMLNCRRRGVDEINQMYGTNISVDFASSWKNNVDEIDNIIGRGGNDVSTEGEDSPEKLYE